MLETFVQGYDETTPGPIDLGYAIKVGRPLSRLPSLWNRLPPARVAATTYRLDLERQVVVPVVVLGRFTGAVRASESARISEHSVPTRLGDGAVHKLLSAQVAGMEVPPLRAFLADVPERREARTTTTEDRAASHCVVSAARK